MPLALTDDQLAIIRQCAEPLDHADRAAYLERCVQLLQGREIGDGFVARVARAAQAEFHRMPAQIEGRGPKSRAY